MFTIVALQQSSAVIVTYHIVKNKDTSRLNASSGSVLDNSAYSWFLWLFNSLITATMSCLMASSTLMSRSSGASWVCGRSCFYLFPFKTSV